MNAFDVEPPVVSEADLSRFAKAHYGVTGSIKMLVSERDQNARITGDNEAYVLKISNAAEREAFLDFQNAALRHIADADSTLGIPKLISDHDGRDIARFSGQGDAHLVRLLTYLEGNLFSGAVKTPALYQNLGRYAGRLSRALKGFGHREAHRNDFLWNLDNVLATERYVSDINEPTHRLLVEAAFARYRKHVCPVLPRLRGGVIHNDLNDNNLIVADDGVSIAGAIDFGDMVYARQVNELATLLAYALFEADDIIAISRDIIAAYVQEFPLEPLEADVLFDLVAMRLVVSVCISSHRSKQFPDNEYLLVSQKPAFKLLGKLAALGAETLIGLTRQAAGFVPYHDTTERPSLPIAAMMEERARLLGPSLSLSYRNKLKIVRGKGAYLYDHTDRAFLDCVNNITHVGHCHPHVVRALASQAAELNTNTRYLHDNIQQYASRLLAKLPAPLSVVYFVCSGSEANELAMRMATTATGRKNMVVLDWAYHGNTSGLVDISPYKFNRKGGAGCPDHVRIAPLPDPYRGQHKGYDEGAGLAYAKGVQASVEETITDTGQGPAAFIAESIAGVGGQVIYPKGFLKHAYEAVRRSGGLCIADEVQVGFGRVGSHMWAFEQQGVVPDIVTLGKPIGNGHPMAAVVTTQEIASAFANGMEYFNSFGGNPVSCAVGMAVLDVIEQENLQQHAEEVGRYLISSLRELQGRYDLVGDVRGTGLFVGVELVEDHETLAPASRAADAVVQYAREHGVLLSTDGPFENVIKIKPPMVFGYAEADKLVGTLDRAFQQLV